MPHAIERVMPRPGPVWGGYPMRAAEDTAPLRRPLALAARPWSPLGRARRIARDAQAHSLRWATLAAPERAAALAAIRRRLRHDGLVPAVLAEALGLVAGCAADVLGQTPRPPQCIAAAALLDQRLAEMATGEGKTLALALAAAVAALAGMPVHVITANDYLAGRDAATLAPLYAALGLRAAALPVGREVDDAARRAAYAHDVVYATARELAFDFLRDRLAANAGPLPGRPGAGPDRATTPPLLRGLCMALLDEADSLLLDEAEVPLILSRRHPQAARRAFLWQALALARQLVSGADFEICDADRSATLSASGEARIAALAAGLGGPWQRPRYRREAIVVALTALHLCRRDAHYVVRDGAIELLDEVTGRIATGRVWSRGLHTVVALKEGLVAPADTETVAQITYQRFFQRYWRVAGLSGTLREAGAELRALTGSAIVRIPRHTASRLRRLPCRIFPSETARWAAVCQRVAQLQAQGRPVLVGTDSVAESQVLSAQLQAAGVAHRVLNALHDADEASIVAEAGSAGRVTVATRMAGRGTDIRLDARAVAAGGLHVLSCQDNRSHRLDRQLAGRAARHGDPGSSESWLLRRISTSFPTNRADTLLPWISFQSAGLMLAKHRLGQWLAEHHGAARRAALLRDDRHSEQRLAFAGPPA